MFYLCNAKVLVENSSGNLGIGMTNPGYKLDIAGGDVRVGAKELKEGEGKHIGFVAQELKGEFPELVVTDQKGDNAVDYDKMTAVLVEAIKEQQRQIADLRSEISQLKAQSQAR